MPRARGRTRSPAARRACPPTACPRPDSPGRGARPRRRRRSPPDRPRLQPPVLGPCSCAHDTDRSPGGRHARAASQGFFVVGVVMVGFGAVVAGTVEGTVVAVTVVGTAVAAVEGGTAVVGEACGEVVPVDCRGR